MRNRIIFLKFINRTYPCEAPTSRRLKPRLPLPSRPTATGTQSAPADFATVAANSFAWRQKAEQLRILKVMINLLRFVEATSYRFFTPTIQNARTDNAPDAPTYENTACYTPYSIIPFVRYYYCANTVFYPVWPCRQPQASHQRDTQHPHGPCGGPGCFFRFYCHHSPFTIHDPRSQARSIPVF